MSDRLARRSSDRSGSPPCLSQRGRGRWSAMKDLETGGPARAPQGRLPGARGARERAPPRGRSGLCRTLLTVRVATNPGIERVADRLLEFLVALTGRKVLGGGLGTSANGTSGNGLDAPLDRLRVKRVTDHGRDNRGHRRVPLSRMDTRTEPSKAPTARASDSNRPNGVVRSFGITDLPASY